MNLKGFFNELKRRNVYKVALTYSLVSWVIIQISDTIFPRLNFPDWTVTFIILILGIGFPVALLLAWAFDMSPEGMIRTNSKTIQKELVQSNNKNSNRIKFVIIFLLVAIIGQFTYIKFQNNGRIKSVIHDRSIAVLPFHDLSPNNDKEYFSDGMMEEILNHLHKIGELRVTSRTSSMQYKGEKDKSIHDIAKELGVAHILEGSVRLDGDKVRITIQLIKAETDEHLYAENFDRNFSDIFSIQSEVAQEVAKALETKISSETKRIIELLPTQSTDAYDLFLKSLELDRYNEKENAKAIKLLEKALEFDPEFSTAYANIGLRLAVGGTFISGGESMNSLDAWQISKPYYEKALKFDPDNYFAHILMAWSLLWYEWDFEGARKEYEETKRIFPNYSWADFLIATGQFEEAYNGALRNVEVDSRNTVSRQGIIVSAYFTDRDVESIIEDALTTPFIREDILVRSESARIYMYLKKYNQALSILNQLFKDFPNIESPRMMAIEAISQYHSNRINETNRIIKELLLKSDNSGGGSPSFYLAMIYAEMGETDLVFEWLDRSLQAHEVEMYWLKVEPPFEGIRNDIRYKELVNKIGYPE